jgi:hypothetical protein
MMISISRLAPIMSRYALAVSIAVLVAAGLSACSTPTKASTSTARPDALPPTTADPATQASSAQSVAATGSACALVTTAEVTAAIGKPMGPGNDAGAMCVFSATSDPSVVVYVQIYGDAQSLAAPKDVEGGSEHLPGLGDDAFWSASGIVFVQKGSRAFTISVPSLALTSTKAPTAILTLATVAAGRF